MVGAGGIRSRAASKQTRRTARPTDAALRYSRNDSQITSLQKRLIQPSPIHCHAYSLPHCRASTVRRGALIGPLGNRYPVTSRRVHRVLGLPQVTRSQAVYAYPVCGFPILGAHRFCNVFIIDAMVNRSRRKWTVTR